MTATYPFPVSKDEFRGRRVLVTGGTKGMGQAMVRRFTLSGASVATTARSPLPEEQAVALFVQTDIGTAAGVQEAISRIQHEWGGLDILVNNVGGSDAPNGGYRALSDDDWQKALNVNLLASVRLDRAFLPGMIERKSGVILHISSIQHRLPLYDATLAYAAAKGALNTYNKGLANEVGPKGVRVNMISPGFIETSGARGMIVQLSQSSGISEDAARQQIMNMIGGIPVGRPGSRRKWPNWRHFWHPIVPLQFMVQTTSLMAARCLPFDYVFCNRCLSSILQSGIVRGLSANR